MEKFAIRYTKERNRSIIRRYVVYIIFWSKVVLLMTKIKSINSNQLHIAQNVDVTLKLEGNTAQVTFTTGIFM